LLHEKHDHDDHDHHHDDDAQGHEHTHGDANLRAAYLHVLADALTSVLAIIALIAGLFLGWIWMDAVIGILGAVVIAHWSIGLARNAGRTLLDSHADDSIERAVRARLAAASPGADVLDLHVWRLGPGHQGLLMTLRGANLRTPDEYRQLLADVPGLAHITIEINPA
jgi:cation diffusion facilitator family transporter